MKTYYDSPEGQIYCGSALEVLRALPSASVQCVITSPPYWQQRNYGTEGQLGLEATYQEFIINLCNIFNEVERVLKDDGTCFVVIGDSYAGAGGMGSWVDSKAAKGMQIIKTYSRTNVPGIKNKSLIQIPSRFAIEMTDRGWILRSEIIWHKPNAMPTSTKDRFTCDFEKVFFFSKNLKYKFNQQFERNGRNKRCAWSVPTRPSNIKHFAAYPAELVIPCILAGTDERDVIMDPFGGSGTTALTSVKYNRKFVAIDINKDYCDIIATRIKAETAQLKLFK